MSDVFENCIFLDLLPFGDAGMSWENIVYPTIEQAAKAAGRTVDEMQQFRDAGIHYEAHAVLGIERYTAIRQRLISDYLTSMLGPNSIAPLE